MTLGQGHDTPLVQWQATSRKYQGVFEAKSRVKTWQVRGIWSPWRSDLGLRSWHILGPWTLIVWNSIQIGQGVKELWPGHDVLSWVELVCNVTVNDISVIHVTAHRCAGGLKKKLDLRSGSQRHRHFVGFFNVPVLAPTRDHPFYTVIPTHRPI